MENPNEVTMPLSERVLWIARECVELSKKISPETVTDEQLTRILLAMGICQSETSQKEKIDLIPDFSRLDNHYVAWRSFMDRVAKEAYWLLPETKKSLAQLVESLPSFLMRGRYKITYDCFSSRIPQWKRDLAHFAGAPNLRFLEIGSFEGHSAGWLIDNILTHNSAQLVCVDIFENKRAESLYDLNISLSGASHRVTKRVGSSEDELAKLEKNSFDFIYVDGCHEQVSVLQDGVLAWRLLKSGGIMIFDDYQLAEDPLLNLIYSDEHPEVAIDAFLTVLAGRYRLIHKGYQITIQKL
jgi:hypothetical protein